VSGHPYAFLATYMRGEWLANRASLARAVQRLLKGERS